MIIGTHSGTFHCDDAMAVAMLKTLDRFKNAEVRRSRDPKVWATCDIVVDVGGEYNTEKMILDHHQRGFDLVLSDIRTELKNEKWASRTKLSSAGLVYAHFGQEILKNLTENEIDKENQEFQKRIYKFCYTNLLEEVDAVDNGIDQYYIDNPAENSVLSKRYSKTTSLGGRVSNLNSDWDDPNPDFDKNFPLANKICLEEFQDRIHGFHKWWKAREIVVEAVNNRFSVDPVNGRAIDLPQFCPWKAHLEELEEEGKVEPGSILYCLYASGDGSFRVQCVGKQKGSFENRKSLPESWRGLRDEAFCKETGVADLVFCHAGGFLCGSKTKESQTALLKMALDA